MNMTRSAALVCTILACVVPACSRGAAQSNDTAPAPLQVPAKSLPVPSDVSPEMQKLIGAPRRAGWDVLGKTEEEWRAAADKAAAKTIQTLPAMRERLHVKVQSATMA